MTNSNFFQLKSMTAFGRGICDFAYGRMTVEIQSVNRRYLEMNINLPREFVAHEMDIRKQIASSVGRGSLNVSIHWKKDEKQPISIVPNFSLAKALNEAWKTLVHTLEIKGEIPLALLAQEKEIFIFSEEDGERGVYQQALLEALQKALDDLSLMKQSEGSELREDLLSRLKLLQEAIAYVDEHAKDASEKYRQKLVARLEELFQGHSENEERVLREVAIYAEKMDISEEITRFKSHLTQFKELLNKPLEHRVETRGKTLDFLLQELNRESNTMNAKAADLNIIQQVILIKGELEKIREQIQNIE